jgi:hypothetical protein
MGNAVFSSSTQRTSELYVAFNLLVLPCAPRVALGFYWRFAAAAVFYLLSLALMLLSACASVWTFACLVQLARICCRFSSRIGSVCGYLPFALPIANAQVPQRLDIHKGHVAP